MRKLLPFGIAFLTGLAVGIVVGPGRPVKQAPATAERIMVSHPAANFSRTLTVLPPDKEPVSADRRKPNEWVVTLFFADSPPRTYVAAE